MASHVSTVAAGSPQVSRERIYAVHCQLNTDWNRRVSWYRITIMRGDDCVCTVCDMSVELGRRLLAKLADRYGLTEAERAGMYAGSIVPFDLHDVSEGGAV